MIELSTMLVFATGLICGILITAFVFGSNKGGLEEIGLWDGFENPQSLNNNESEPKDDKLIDYDYGISPDLVEAAKKLSEKHLLELNGLKELMRIKRLKKYNPEENVDEFIKNHPLFKNPQNDNLQSENALQLAESCCSKCGRDAAGLYGPKRLCIHCKNKA